MSTPIIFLLNLFEIKLVNKITQKRVKLFKEDFSLNKNNK